MSGEAPRSFESSPHFLVFGSSDPLSLGGGCETRISHNLVDRVARLRNDELQMQVGHARDNEGLGSGAVRVDGVGAGAGTPAGCGEYPIGGNGVQLREIAVAVKGRPVDAIDDEGGSVREKQGSVNGEGVAA